MVDGKYLNGYFFPKCLFIREFCEIPFQKKFLSRCWPARKLSTKKIRENRTTDEEFTHVLRHWSPIYGRFALQLSFFLSLNPRLQRLRGPTMWDIFHGSLASLKCKSSCLTNDTLCVASTTKVIDVLLKNKWSVGNIYMVISSLSVYLLENSVTFLFKKILFYGAGLLVIYPPKKNS